MSYERVGAISLWEGTSDNERAPTLRGVIEIGDVEYSVALWPFDGENTSTGPKLKGSVEVRTEAQA